MDSWSPQYRDLWEQTRLATDLNELSELRKSIKKNTDLSPPEISNLELSYFRQVRSATHDGWQEAGNIIRNELLQYCLMQSADMGKEVEREPDWITLDRHQGRELLQGWVEDFPSDFQNKLVINLINDLRPLLDTSQAREACYVLSSLGYKDDAIIEHLFEHAQENSTLTGTLVDTVISLGVTYDPRLTPLIKRLIDSSEPHQAVFALSKMDASQVKELIEQCIRRIEAESSESGHLHLVLSACSKTIARHEDDNSLQDWFWDIAREHKMIVLIDNQIASSLNSKEVVPDILNWLTELITIEDEYFRLWRVSNRLENCSRPKQLSSWKEGCNDDALELVRHIAVSNLGKENIYETIDNKAVHAAWRILLSVGFDDIQELLKQAESNSSNRYVLGEIFSTVACLAFKDLPKFVTELIENEYDCNSSDINSFLLREGASSIARSSASYQAFKALLNFGYTYEGKVLLNISEALAEVAVYLCNSGNEHIIPNLLDRISRQNEPRHREASCRAIARLGSSGLFPASHAHLLIQSIQDKDLPDFARADLISALHGLELSSDSKIVSKITELAKNSTEIRIVWECCVFLIRQPFWEKFTGIVRDRIGLNIDSIVPIDKELYNGWRAWLVGELFLRSPSHFSKELAFILRNCEDNTCYQIARCLQRTSDFTDEVVDAIEFRIINDHTPYQSYTFLFDLLARIDLSRLLSTSVLKSQEYWSVESKVAFATALGNATTSDTTCSALRMTILDALIGDGALPVRRAANLAMLRCDSDAFVKIWRYRARSTDLQLRLRAAESIEFLPKSIWSNMSDNDIQQLKQDSYRAVRGAIEDAFEHADRRWRANFCLNRIKEVKGTSNNEMFAAFPYGEALKRCGDNETIESLTMYLLEEKLPPNVLTWVRQIIKAIEKSRDDNKREISHGWNAIIEQFDGILESNTQKCDATFHLWKVPNEDFSNLGRWGGTVTLGADATGAFVFNLIFGTEHVTVSGDGRCSGEAIVTKTTNNKFLIINGSGQYPSKAQD